MKELINLRKPREKHFLNKDGTITAYMYDEDIHYLDNGEYKEIDNSLIEESEFITNKNNNFKIKLYKNKYLVNIDLDNNDYLNITLKNSFGVYPKLNNNEIIYEDVLPNVDFRYFIHGKSLKENIYLKKKINTNIIFNIETNLKLILEKNKVLAKNKDKVIYTFEPLFMKDSNNNINRNCHYSLIENNGYYELQLILDEKYLENASYPVLVDPSINTDQLENVFDATLFSDNPDHVQGIYYDYLSIGCTHERTTRGLLKFVLPNIKTGDNIISATAYLTPKSNNLFKELKPIGVYEINTDWSEANASWNTMSNKYNREIETYFYSTSPDILGENKNYTEIDLTNLVKAWYAGKTNNGVMLKLIDESYNNEDFNYVFYSKTYDIYSQEGEEPKRPFMLVNYREQNGILDYMTYETCQLSKGTVNVNNCTGNLTTQISLNEILESNSSIDLTLTYNSGDVIANVDNKFGLGFNISYNEDIVKETDITLGGDLYKYTLCDGAVHYFYKQDDEAYKDEDGLDLTLEVINEESKAYTLVDKNSNKFIFANSRLSKIEYADGSLVTITRDMENRIIKLNDSKENIVNISYEENKISIISKKSVIINLTNNKISSITTKDGNISFVYDSNSLITKINDLTGMSIGLEYYDISPYKIKKIIQYGLNNTIGKYKTFEYGFYSTTVCDNLNLKYRYSFNRLGNTLSTMLVSKDGTLKNTFGFSESYINELGTPTTNKIQTETLPLSSSENLLFNSSLESNEGGLFIANRSSEEARTGLYSAKITSTTSSLIDIHLNSNKLYVFSAFIKSQKGCSIQIKLYQNSIDDIAEESKIYEFLPSETFERFEMPVLPGNSVNLMEVIVTPFYSSTVYIDDMQLEEGEVASTYNIIDNGNFIDGINGWTVSGGEANTHEIITLESGEKTLKLASSIDGGYVLSKTIPMNGKKGDVYTLSFMYKNEGIIEGGDLVGNFAHLNFGYPEDPDGLYNHGTYDVHLNYHSKEWQMYNESFVAEEDYDSVTIDVLSMNEINSIYVTNFSLVKDLGSYTYNYDDEGNLVSTYDVISNKSEFKYGKNNELISAFDAKGNNFKYEYDNQITDRVLKGISPTGISNEMKYDEHGNVIKTIINNVNPKGSELEGNYYIRSKGTNKYVTPNLKNGELTLREDMCSHYSYKIDSHVETEIISGKTIQNKVYTFESSILPTYVLNMLNNTIILLKNGNHTNFELIKKNNGSNNIKIYKKDLYLRVTEDNKLILASLDDSDSAFEFYFEDVDANEFIETTSKYSKDGKFVTEIEDSLGKKTIYNKNPETGLTNFIKNPKGILTSYIYDDKSRLKSVELDHKKAEYTYNNDSKITSIKSGGKELTFNYNDFGRISEVKLNNNILASNNYEENNGNIKNITFGNGNKITYGYDELNRVKSISSPFNSFYNCYNNLGLLSKVDRYESVYERYYYDFAKRLSSYIYLNKFKINYKYDANSNINHKDYILFNNTDKIDYEFNEDDSVIKIKFDNNSVNYEYDYLGRLKSKNINGYLPEYFTYKRNGNKTSLIVDTMKIGEDIYKYLYDDLYNIIEIIKNNETLNKYTYDNRSQLLSDENCDLNKKYVYTYDNEGNILTKKEYNLETNDLIKNDIFEYGNISWEDQLTKFNNETLTYDAIGNPLTIGNKLLSWGDGKNLLQYRDGEKSIYYTYNQDGIRTTKCLTNQNFINYYLEGNKIVYEERDVIINNKTETNMLYYIYDDSGNILGLKYNDTVYYYQKNYQNDIIGIYDSNYNLVVTYKYDAWGKVISVIDSTSNNIGTINPFRYRSYYYDEETKLYYLNSRYYNPEWGRFINADDLSAEIGNVLSHNMYNYTNNNPINLEDSEGNLPRWAKNAIKIGIGAIAIGIGVAVTVYSGGSAGPAIAAGIKTALVVGGVSAGVAASVSVAKSIVKKEDVKTTIKNAVDSAIDGFADGFMTGGISAGIATCSVYAPTSNGIKIGRTAKEKYGRISLWYGETGKGRTLVNFANKAGQSKFRIDFDKARHTHVHFKGLGYGMKHHRQKLTEIVFGFASGIVEGSND